MEPQHRFLRACRRLPVDRTPIWIMRQAGRYLPQYQQVRSKVSFLELCKTPELACEVTVQPIDEFGMDAAILFSDILIPLEAMGMHLDFTDHGPKLEPVTSRRAIDELAVPDPVDTMGFVMEAVRTIRQALAGRVPLIGFAGAPFTMASYAVEGGTSKSFLQLKELMFAAPDVAHDLFGKITDTVSAYLLAQIEAGAEAVQLFDSWAGVLSSRDFDEWALPYAKRIIDAVGSRVPFIYFVNGCAPYLDRLKACGADVVGIDWRIDLAEARRRLGPELAVQGNLDPTALFLPPEQIEERVKEVLAAGGKIGHIFNLGHGIFPSAKVEHVRVLVDAVKKYG